MSDTPHSTDANPFGEIITIEALESLVRRANMYSDMHEIIIDEDEPVVSLVTVDGELVDRGIVYVAGEFEGEKVYRLVRSGGVTSFYPRCEVFTHPHTLFAILLN